MPVKLRYFLSGECSSFSPALTVLYTRTDWTNAEIQQRLSAAEKMEVLIPDCVPRNLIAGIV